MPPTPEFALNLIARLPLPKGRNMWRLLVTRSRCIYARATSRLPRPDTAAELRRKRIIRRAQSTPLFDPAAYSALNKDAKRAGDPYTHYAMHGLDNGLSALDQNGLARIFGELRKNHPGLAKSFLDRFEAAQQPDARVDALISSATFAVAVHSRGNYYMEPIARALQHALSAAGANCILTDETDPRLLQVDYPIIVAPHEFFVMPLHGKVATKAFLQRTILYNTEQMPSQWFHSALKYIYGSRAVLDVSFQTSEVFRTGMPAEYVLPPFDEHQLREAFDEHDPKHPLFQWTEPGNLDWEPDRLINNRYFDIFFAGFKTTERNRIFVKNAQYFANKQCFLAYTGSNSATPPTDQSRRIFPTNISVARNTKIVLSLHRYSIGYFEWERMVAQGFATGACVVASPGLPSPFFQEGVHYLEAPSRNLDKLLRWLLDTPEGTASAQKVADAGKAALQKQLSAKRVGRHLLSFLSRLDPNS